MKTSVNWPPELVQRVKAAAVGYKPPISVSSFTAMLIEEALPRYETEVLKLVKRGWSSWAELEQAVNKDSKDASDTQDE